MHYKCNECGYEADVSGTATNILCPNCLSANTSTVVGTALDVDSNSNTVTVDINSAITAEECPDCGETITHKRAHADGCPKWGMKPQHWED